MKKNNYIVIIILVTATLLGFIEFVPITVFNVPPIVQKLLFNIPPIISSIVSLFLLITGFFLFRKNVFVFFILPVFLSVLFSPKIKSVCNKITYKYNSEKEIYQQKSLFLGNIKQVKNDKVVYSWFHYFDDKQDLIYQPNHKLSTTEEREITVVYDKNWFTRNISLFE